MPIVDVQIVCKEGADAQPAAPAQALADQLGQVFGSGPGRTWVRIHTLPDRAYAENHIRVEDAGLPAFVTILHAHPPAGEALVVEVLAISAAVASWLGRPVERVHVQYAPAGAGRQAFGGRLVE